MSRSAMVASFWGALFALAGQVVILLLSHLHQVLQMDVSYQFAFWTLVFTCLSWTRLFLGVALLSYDTAGLAILSTRTSRARALIVGLQVILIAAVNISMSLYDGFRFSARIIAFMCAAISIVYMLYIAAIAVGGGRPRAKPARLSSGIWAASIFADAVILLGLVFTLLGMLDIVVIVHVVQITRIEITILVSVLSLFLLLISCKVFWKPMVALYQDTRHFLRVGTLSARDAPAGSRSRT